MNPFIHNEPFYIAGPCSAETEDQVLQTAIRLKKTGKVHILRAGIWKPRTRPGSFEGVGDIGLPWMVKARNETGLPIITEAAKAKHVELCLKHDFDALWIGARTTANPFAVQELADALKGVDIPILVKNPVNPDLSLWIGGVERMIKAGIKNLGVIHRGFSHAGEKVFRNKPQWQIAIDFMNEMPDIPMICDPSHICGRRDLLKEVAQKSLDLNYNGLMIESHITPNDAWSDAAQQITPEVYKELIDSLIIRDHRLIESNELTKLRSQIDLIDDELIQLLASRMIVSQEIGKYKKANNVTILQSSRWRMILQKYLDKGAKHQLSEEFIASFIKAVHNESISQQEHVFTKKD